jgi:hypothetical protein
LAKWSWRILVDHARAHLAEKRGGDFEQVNLTDSILLTSYRPETLHAVNEALDRLQKRDEGLARIAEFRFSGGMTDEETAEVLDLSARTVKRDWKPARMVVQSTGARPWHVFGHRKKTKARPAGQPWKSGSGGTMTPACHGVMFGGLSLCYHELRAFQAIC